MTTALRHEHDLAERGAAFDPRFAMADAILVLHRELKMELYRAITASPITTLELFVVFNAVTRPGWFERELRPGCVERYREAERFFRLLLTTPLTNSGKSYIESAAGLFRDAANALEKIEKVVA